jgi:cytochrome P450
MTLDTRVRWGARHGIAGFLLRQSARRGALDSALSVDPELRAYPFDAYDQIRPQGEFSKGVLARVTARHALVAEVLRSDDFGVARNASNVPRAARAMVAIAGRKKTLSPIEPPSLLAVDPPDHARYRRLVSKIFTVRAVESLRGEIETTATQLLDAMEDRAANGQPVDLVTDYANLLPVTVICQIEGVPLEMRDQFLKWGAAGSVTLDIGIKHDDFVTAENAIIALRDWTYEHFARLRANPGDDMLSQMLMGQEKLPAEERLTDEELAGVAMLLLGAGFETTVNLLGNGVIQLLENPEQLKYLKENPEGWANAVEEVLRYDSPVQRTARIAKHDVTVGETKLTAGTFVITLIGGANRDPAVFTDPHRFDVQRENAKDHLAFSGGIHYCLGAALARMEGEIGLRMLFERYPDLGLAGAPTRRPTQTLRGYARLPMYLRPPQEPYLR